MGLPIWLMCVIIFMQDSVVFPYISNLGTPMLVIKYGFTEEQAASIVFLPYIISPFLGAPIGYIVDKSGHRVLYCRSFSITNF
jgi:hypothetical protein